MQSIDGWTLLYQIIYYFPWYVGLVLVPMVIRVTIERAIGIRPETFEDICLPILGMSYETAFKTITLTVLYYPLFEELIFRGLPYFFFGWMGVVIGSTVWVLMHPAWQLQYLSKYPLSKKIIFTLTSTGYYVSNAIFYSMLWINDAGLVAILYHIIHNGWLTLGDIIREIELPSPWKRLKFIKKQPVAEEPRLRGLMRRRQSSKDVEEEENVLQMRFVVKKTIRSLEDEVEEAKRFMFVKRKLKNEE